VQSSLGLVELMMMMMMMAMMMMAMMMINHTFSNA